MSNEPDIEAIECETCGGSGWVASGTWTFLMADALPCPDCDNLRRAHQWEKRLLARSEAPSTPNTVGEKKP